jgi:integral membrane sensor domain MASE1
MDKLYNYGLFGRTIFSLVTLFGLGYLIISLVLRFKRIGSFLAICQYLYLGILLTQFEKADLLVKEHGQSFTACTNGELDENDYQWISL